MAYILNPEVLDKARQSTGATSDEQLGQLFLYKTGATIRKWRKGETTPDLESLMVLRKLSKVPFAAMVLEVDEKGRAHATGYAA